MLASRKNLAIAFGGVTFVLALAVAVWPDAVKQRIAREVALAATPEEAVHAHTIRVAVPSDGPADIVADPTDLPAPIGTRAPKRMRVDLETVELTGKLADGATYRYWTFNRQVPGPFIRVRVGDTVEVHLTNSHDSKAFHNVDFHAVTGPGGGG